jgi:hypothetical protein
MRKPRACRAFRMEGTGIEPSLVLAKMHSQEFMVVISRIHALRYLL